MRTIKLKISDSVYKHFMWFLERFKKDEIQIVDEEDEFLSVKEYLSKELQAVEEGKAGYISLDQLDEELENTIRKYET